VFWCRRDTQNGSRFEHLVALLPPLQTLNALFVHFLFHLREALPLLLRRALGTDSLDSSLDTVSRNTGRRLRHTYLSFCFLFVLQLFLFCLGRIQHLPLRGAFLK
jgi:hypothetical protein